jgi:hypothetical protein
MKMTARLVLCLLTALVTAPVGGDLMAQPIAPTAVGAAEVEALGALNGQALACRSFSTSETAKALMTRYAPKTRLYGVLFESATNAGFKAQTKAAEGCPSDMTLGDRLLRLESQLRLVFPSEAEPVTAAGER